MNEAAQVVGVVAFFREPGQDAGWKLSIPKKQWKKTDPVRIDVRDSTLSVAGIGDKAVKRHSAPQTLNTPQTASPGATPTVRPASKVAPVKDDWARPA